MTGGAAHRAALQKSLEVTREQHPPPRWAYLTPFKSGLVAQEENAGGVGRIPDGSGDLCLPRSYRGSPPRRTQFAATA